MGLYAIGFSVTLYHLFQTRDLINVVSAIYFLMVIKPTKVPKNELRLSSANVLVATCQYLTWSILMHSGSHLGTKKSASKERISKAAFMILSVSPLARPMIPDMEANQLVPCSRLRDGD